MIRPYRCLIFPLQSREPWSRLRIGIHTLINSFHTFPIFPFRCQVFVRRPRRSRFPSLPGNIDVNSTTFSLINQNSYPYIYHQSFHYSWRPCSAFLTTSSTSGGDINYLSRSLHPFHCFWYITLSRGTPMLSFQYPFDGYSEQFST